MRWWGAGVDFESFPATREQVFLHITGHTWAFSFLCGKGSASYPLGAVFLVLFSFFLFFHHKAYEQAMGLVSGLLDCVWRKSHAEKAH